MSDQDPQEPMAGEVPNEGPTSEPSSPDPVGSMPPPVGPPPPGSSTALGLPGPAPDESPRVRRKREREEKKRLREEEKARRRGEREEQKRQRAELRAAGKSGTQATSVEPVFASPTDDEPQISPADEATATAMPEPPGLSQDPTVPPDSSQEETASFGPVPPPEMGRKAAREEKKRQREAQKMQAQAERERAREERRRAVEQRRQERAAAKAARKGRALPEAEVPSAPSEVTEVFSPQGLLAPADDTSPEAGPTIEAQAGEAGDARLGLGAAVAAVGAGTAGILAARSADDEDERESPTENLVGLATDEAPDGPPAAEDSSGGESPVDPPAPGLSEPDPVPVGLDDPDPAPAGLTAADFEADEAADEADDDPATRVESAEQREDDALVAAGSRQAEADAERRVREVEQMRIAAEARAADARIEAEEESRRRAAEEESAAEAEEPMLLSNELRLTDQQIQRRRQRDEELRTELDQTESRIETNRSRTEQALEEARARLELIESQAGEAEERAQRAERLAELRQQEAERERRLHEMLERINEAERRAREAESRARQAVAGVSRPYDPGTSLPEPLPPEPDPEPLERIAESAAPTLSTPPGPGERSDSEDEAPEGVLSGSQADRDEGDGEDAPGGGGESAVPDFEGEGASEGPSEVHDATDDDGELPAPVDVPEGDRININEATFEQLRDAGLSVTQTGRVLAHRERASGFGSIDELDAIPGFPREFLDEVKPSLTV